MSAVSDRWRAMAERLLNGHGGSTVTWRRRALTVNGPAGTVTVNSTTSYSVRVAQLDAKAVRMFGSESWQNAQVRLVVSAAGLPFTAETASGEPEPRFEDTVVWLGAEMRVTALEQWAAPGGVGAAPAVLAYFVGLGG